MARSSGRAPHLDLEPQVIESIQRHKRRSAWMKLAMIGPLMVALAAVLVLTAYSLATGSASVTRAFTAENGGYRFMWWVVPLALVVAFLLSAVRGGAEPLKTYDAGSDPAKNLFSDALDGVSSAVGISPPELVVLEVPTANSIAFVKRNKPAVGVTFEALVSDLSTFDAEAMMAHEVSHILTGEIFVASSSRQLRRAAYALVFALVTLVVLCSFILRFSWAVPFALVAATPFYFYWLYRMGRLLYRQSDLLADSVAVKITYNPAAMRAAIVKLAGLYSKSKDAFEKGKRFPDYMFIRMVRPDVEMRALDELESRMEDKPEPDDEKEIRQDFDRRLKKRNVFFQATIQDRVENLKAIELGHWIEFGEVDT
jgi:Zn-dependent protease with chaperone function